MKQLPIIKKLFTYLNADTRLRIGAAPIQGSFHYVITAIDKNGKTQVVSYGSDISKLLFIPPVAMYTTLTDTKVSYIKDQLNKEEVDNWLDRNEERIIPPGFTSDQIVNEWDVQENTMYSATVTKDSFDEFQKTIPAGKLLVSSISIPLWDLAILYSHYNSGPFVIWKITDKGSMLGFITDGRLQSLCHFWPDYEDIQQDAEKVGKELSPLIKSLTLGEEITEVILIFDIEKRSLPSHFSIPNYTLGTPPQIDSLPGQYHEAYACSLHQETHLDFAQYSDTQKTYALEKKRRYFLKGLKWTVVSLAGVAMVLLLGTLIITGIQKYAEKKVEPLKTYIKQIEEGENRLDSLKTVYMQKASFLGRESIVTFLMNELQLVFTEGTWAQHIEITEAGTSIWHINVIALAYSTALIPQLLSNLEAVKGISNVRMIYSEQTKVRRKRAIKVKIECNWTVK